MNNVKKIPDNCPLVSEELKNQMTPLFSKMNKKVRLVAVLDFADEKNIEMGAFLKAIASCSNNLELEVYEKDENAAIQEELQGQYLPVVGLYGERYTGVCFHGTPGGKEINSFIAAICNLGGAAQPLDEKLENKIVSIKEDIHIKIFVSLACHHCPHVVAACQKIALASPRVIAEMYDAKLYPDIIEKYQIERVPMTVINDSKVILGQKTIEEFADYLVGDE